MERGGRGRGRVSSRGARGGRGSGGARGGARGGRGGRGGDRGSRGGARGGSGGRGRGRGASSASGWEGAARPDREDDRGAASEPAGPAVVEEPVVFRKMTPQELSAAKSALLNTVSSSLIKEPRFNSKDSVTIQIKRMVKVVAFYDPEFVLKLALYARDDLNIRSTSNFVLAVASNVKECQPYLKIYMKSIIRLPSDWLDVASTYMILPDRYLKDGALPTALRKSMVEKFPDFDAYQLGKYNKERSIKKKVKKNKENNKEKRPDDKPTLTIKQMIRQLHIKAPVYNVMCILGKKYPATLEEFQRLSLPGDFEPPRISKRMKLPIAETWETLLSEKGNKASTWEELIEHKKLPFMAMLRNLRNLIFTGVHPKYHRWVMNKLNNERAVAQSRQFPTRFFSAYEVIPKDVEDFKAKLEAMNNPKKKEPKEGAKPVDEAEEEKRRAKKKKISPAFMPAATLFDEYRQALDNAVKLATVFNVKPIRGGTVVFINADPEMKNDCSTAKGMGALKKLNEISTLLGLMCKYACEECEVRVFSSASPKHPKGHIEVEVIEGSILENMKVVLKKAEELGKGNQFPFDFMEDLIKSKKRIDNLIVLSHEVIAPGHAEMARDNNSITSILKKYRQEVNPDLLFVSVDLSGRGLSVLNSAEAHPNDVVISGFSDSILRFIAERGDDNQLRYVENINVSKKIVTHATPKMPVHLKQLDKIQDSIRSEVSNDALLAHGGWKNVRVFISSTFLDMHGERDVLLRHVFPELRERCKKLCLNLVEVDLRWGVTEYETQQNKSVEICLSEVDRCSPFFIGVLGNRYGWIPPAYVVPDEPRFDWVKEYPTGRSITELEVELGCLRKSRPTRALFYLRNPSFLAQVPPEHERAFTEKDESVAQKLEDLKGRIRASGGKVTDYKTVWAGVVDGKPMVRGLEKFRKAVLEDMWNSIVAEYGEAQQPPSNELAVERSYHLTVIHSRSRNFVGRKDLMDQLTTLVNDDSHSSVVVVGKPGSGKSALVSAFTLHYARANPKVFVLPHFIGAAPGSTDIRHTLRRLCKELSAHFGTGEDDIPDDYKELCQAFVRLVEEASFSKRIVLILDGLDQLSKSDRAQSMDWLPSNLPIKVVLSTLEGPILNALRRRKPQIPELIVGPLTVKERKEIVQVTLGEFRKKLDDRPMNDQERVLLKKADADKPLYLVLACHELRFFGVFEQLSEKIKSLPPTIPKLFEDILVRLELDHGRDLIKPLMSFIACSRGGLYESELLFLLRRRDKQEVELPRAIWSRIFSGLDLLVRPAGEAGDGMLEFFHRELSKAVRKRYLDTDQENELLTHKLLAECFYHRADPLGDGSFSTSDIHAISELPHHLIQAKLWKTLGKCLCSFDFIENKCKMSLAFDLNRDYQEASTATWKGHDREKENLEDFRRFFTSNSHILAHSPMLAFQQAMNQPDSTSPYRVATGLGSDNPFVQWVNKPQQHDACKLTIKVSDSVSSVTVSPTGDRILCATKDCMMKLFDSTTALELVSYVGHTNWITSCNFSRDGTRIVSSSWDQTVKLWDVETGVEQSNLTGHTRIVSASLFSPDGKMVASSGWDCKVILWDSTTGKQVKYLSGHSKPVNACAFSPDNKYLLSASWDGTMILWDPFEGTKLKTFQSQSKSIRSCAFSPNGKHIVSASVDSTVRMWDSFSGKEITSLLGHTQTVNACTYSRDGQQLVSASDDGTVKVWDGILGSQLMAASCKSGCANHIAFSKDGSTIATAGSECVLSLWNGNDLSHIVDFVGGHTRALTCVCFSADGKSILSSSDDSNLILWDVATRKERVRFTGHRDVVGCCALSEDGTRALSASDDFSVRLWDTKDGSEVLTLKGHSGVVKACAYSPNGKYIASGGRDNAVFLWNSSTGALIAQFAGHKDWINVLAFSADSKRVVSGSWDYTLKIWDVRKGTEKASLQGHGSAISGCQFSPEGKQVISSCYDGTLKVWDAEAGSELTTLIGHNKRVNQFAMSPDGSRVVSVSDDGGIKAWDALAANELATFVGHSGTVTGCAFGSKYLVSAAEDASLKVWDTTTALDSSSSRVGHSKPVNCIAYSKTGSVLVSASDDHTLKMFSTNPQSTKYFRTLRGHTAPVRSCAFSEGFIASASDDCTVKLWDSQSGRLIHNLTGHTNTCTSVAFSPNGSQLASSSWDRTIRLWSSKGSSLKNIEVHSDWVSCLAFSPNAMHLLSGGYDNKLIISNVNKGTKERVLGDGSNWIKSCAFNSNGTTAFSGSFDKLVQLWDVETGTLLSTQEAHNSSVNSVACGMNDQILLSAGSDNCLKLWDIRTGSEITKFPSSAGCTSVVVNGNQIAVSDIVGNVYLLGYQV